MRAPVALLLIGTACHAVDRVDAPDFQDAESLLLIGIGDDARHALAVGADDEGVVRLPPIVQRSDMDLWALSFTCPIERVGFEPGPLLVNDGPTERPPLEVPHQIFHTRVEGSGTTSWSEAARSQELEETLARLPPTAGTCESAGRFATPTRVLLPSEELEFFTFAVPIEDGRVVVGSTTGRTFMIARDGTASVVSTGHDRVLVAAFAHPLGPIFAIDDAGMLLKGDFDSGLESTGLQAPMAVGADIADLVGPPSMDAGPFELFLVSYRNRVSATLSRFDGSAWSVVASRDEPNELLLLNATWIGPGEVITFGIGNAGREAPTVTRYADGAVTHERVGSRGITSVGYHERYGPLAGTNRGEVYVRRDGSWSRLFGGSGAVNILVPVGPALWTNSVVGFNPPASETWFWDEDRGVCERALSDGYILALLPLGGSDYLRVNQIDINGSFFVDLVSLERQFVDCTGR